MAQVNGSWHKFIHFLVVHLLLARKFRDASVELCKRFCEPLRGCQRYAQYAGLPNWTYSGMCSPRWETERDS